MADSKLQREYTLAGALCDIAEVFAADESRDRGERASVAGLLAIADAVDKLRCARQPLDLHANPSQRPTCAREMWHTGPHMDRTAIAHAGKAGMVWE